ncbi:fatty acid desaturase [Spirosoma sp. BT702]|uniref:Fatty acid desaturase n=1 Tax=Spirosoma profusum TaxID=2771354 RepID=A0A926Y293_9BACT|nr:fatty acid desaturase [Spirosoma profusum]MBD2702872.1 fatty acid desaturase [Spirosoma profusum]
MMKYGRYLIPASLTLLFAALTVYTHFGYFFGILLLANLFANPLLGEFTNEEIHTELTYFQDNSAVRTIKIGSGLLFLAFLIWGIHYVNNTSLSTGTLIGFSLSVGLITGCFLVTLAHDLLHGRSTFEHGLANALFVAAGIPHFTNDHITGHHRLMGLPEDKTTAQYGDSFYTYFGKSFWSRIQHSYFSTYALPEKLRNRLNRENWLLALCLLMCYVAIGVWASHPIRSMAFFAIQGFMANVLYELINYIQHYGLKRHRLDGRYEAVTLQHSWNCYYKYSNYLLFLLPLHSVHHVSHHYLHRPGQNLMGPRMPFVYFVMVAMALVPPIWFRVMNPLVRRHQVRPEPVGVLLTVSLVTTFILP